MNLEKTKELAQQLYDRFVNEGSPLRVAKGDNVPQLPFPINVRDLEENILGAKAVGIRSAWNGFAKWIAVDIDTSDPDNLQKALDLIRQVIKGECYPVFSGRKGYHVYVFLDKPTEVKRVGPFTRYLKRQLEDAGIKVDKAGPLLKGVAFMAPLGLHRTTGKRLCFLDEQLNEIVEPLDWLRNIQTVNLDKIEFKESEPRKTIQAQEAVSERAASSPALSSTGGSSIKLHYRPCVNRLYNEGLQKAGTRHSAMLTMALAIRQCSDLAAKDKRKLFDDWVQRIQPIAQEKSFTKSSLEDWQEEADRIYKMESQGVGWGVTCHNSLLRPAMESACDDMSCAASFNRGKEKFDVGFLIRLGIFSPSNAHKPGIGRAGLSVYEGLIELQEEFEGKFTYEGMAAFAAPQKMVQELSETSPKTCRTALTALQTVGLTVRVPKNKVPPQYRRKRPGGAKYLREAAFLCLPRLDRELIERKVLPAARDYSQHSRRKRK